MDNTINQVVIDVGRTSRGHVLVGRIVVGVLCVGTAIEAGRRLAYDQLGTAAVMVALTVLFGMALRSLIVDGQRATRPRRLRLDAAGLQWEAPAGEEWAVGWRELQAVTVLRATRRPPATAVIDAPQTFVWLHLVPADPHGFGARHPRLARLAQGDGTYRLPLSDVRHADGTAGQAVLRFAPWLYRDPQDLPWSWRLIRPGWVYAGPGMEMP